MNYNRVINPGPFKFVLLLMLFIGVAIESWGQKPISIGVLKVTGPYRTLANGVSDLLTADLSTNEHFTIVDRTQLDKVLSELELGLSGAVNPDTAARVGYLTGAQVLVTGREMMPHGTANVVIIVNVIGTETGQVFSQVLQGPRTNIVMIVADLFQKISDIILKQSTNLLAATDASGTLLDQAIQKARGRTHPAVLIHINETTTESARSIAQNELGLIFQKAGFTVVDGKSERQPDILITGDAMDSDDAPQGNLFSAHATLEIKAREPKTGKILALDLQHDVGVDSAQETAAAVALKNATDALAARLLPILAQ